jgi:23S rRNA (adenine2503-C2)-methyltransferase
MANVGEGGAGGDSRRALLELEPDELRTWLKRHGEPPMRARQMSRWLLRGRAESFEHMTDLPRALRENLASEFVVLGSRIARHLEAKDGTHKLLLRLHDDELIECVLLQEADRPPKEDRPAFSRRTACISTQVGCGMGCVFCASGLGGVARNLTSSEILEQLIRLRNLLPPQERLTHIVVMGMGEPLANLDNLIAALDVAGDKEGLGIGARHITISTVGLPLKIRRLADLGKQYHLAVSLHAPNDGVRTQIVPTNDKTGLPAILAAADYFFERTGRQVTFEYVLLRGVNDSVEQVRELAGLLHGRHAHLNLIPFNDVAGLPYRRPTDEALARFVNELRHAGVSVKVRKRKGSEIDAACGQLRRSEVSTVGTLPGRGGLI